MLYHVEVFMPKFHFPIGQFKLRYTTHAIKECNSDRYGIVIPPQTLNTEHCSVIEVETGERNEIIKIVYRQRLDANRDIAIAVDVTRQPWTVKTIWVNLRSDNHRTLNKSKYVKPA